MSGKERNPKLQSPSEDKFHRLYLFEIKMLAEFLVILVRLAIPFIAFNLLACYLLSFMPMTKSRTGSLMSAYAVLSNALM